jgi:hypothetical protein
VRDFWVREEHGRELEQVFGCGGMGSEFLKRSRQYIASELRLESQAERRFRLSDYWTSHLGFEVLRRIHQLDCDKLEQFIRREELVRREEFVGAFYIDDPGLGEGDEWVPS